MFFFVDTLAQPSADFIVFVKIGFHFLFQNNVALENSLLYKKQK